MKALQIASDSACEQVLGGSTEMSNEAPTGIDKTLTWVKKSVCHF